jgi:hypothetical protein
MEPKAEASLRSGPPWMWALAGWLLASSELAPIRRTFDDSAFSSRIPVAARATPAVAPAVSDPDRMSPRELRRLPAIGPARALAIARARWERGLSGGPEAWEDVPGIGPETVGRIRRALAAAAESSRVVRSP